MSTIRSYFQPLTIIIDLQVEHALMQQHIIKPKS